MVRSKWYQSVPLVLAFTFLIGTAATVGGSNGDGPITPNDEFPVISIDGTPAIDPASYRLVVNGTVENVLNLTLDELKAMPSVTVTAELRSVSGPEGRARWTGVPLRAILDMASLDDASVDVAFFSADGYSTSLTVEEASADDVLLCFEMNGEPLPPDQGFPVRVVAPGHWGYKWAKWVTHIEVVDHDFRGYWESRGWSDNARMTPQSDWYYHAILLTAAGVAGVLSGVSGTINGWRRINGRPYVVSPRVHAYLGYAFTILSIAALVWWVSQTYVYRGAVGYTWHGRLAVPAVVLGIIGLATGVLLVRRRKGVRPWHSMATLLGLTLFIITIVLGLLLAYG